MFNREKQNLNFKNSLRTLYDFANIAQAKGGGLFEIDLHILAHYASLNIAMKRNQITRGSFKGVYIFLHKLKELAPDVIEIYDLPYDRFDSNQILAKVKNPYDLMEKIMQYLGER
jgi:hypothetical protein